jgi:hypothetical protein
LYKLDLKPLAGSPYGESNGPGGLPNPLAIEDMDKAVSLVLDVSLSFLGVVNGFDPPS